MNKREKIVDLKAAAALLDWSMVQNARKNAIAPTGEGVAHFLMKAYLAHGLRVRGFNFYAEAIFKNNTGRADLFVLDKRCAIEVLDSEKEKGSTKDERYPCPIFRVHASMFAAADEVLQQVEDLP